MIGTPMPEASIDKDCNLESLERYVGNATWLPQYLEIDAITQATLI